MIFDKWGDNIDTLKETIARSAYEGNRQFILMMFNRDEGPWEQANQLVRQSTIAGVSALIADPTATPESMHQKWVDYKVAEGWTVGPEKDPIKKIHPNLVPFADLSLAEKIKDVLFIAIVKGCINE